MNIKLPFSGLIFFVLASFLFSGQAHAHRVNVYAWLENGNVIVECNFGRDKPAKAASVTILDSDTRTKLLEGKTNDSGLFTFGVPNVVREGHGLTIDVNAGEGHRNSWTMDAAELYAAAALTAGFDQAAIDAAKQGSAAPDQAKSNLPLASGKSVPAPVTEDTSGTGASSPAQIPHEELKKVINEALEIQIAPLRRQLARQAESGPSFAAITGGLGWIVGIIGIVLYFRSRKKS